MSKRFIFSRLYLKTTALAVVICGSSLVHEARADDKLPELKLVARSGGGLLCTSQGKQILIIAGTPRQMGKAHGTLMKKQARGLVEKTLYVVGAAETIQSGRWFMDRMAEIERRAGPHVPQRFVVECDALSQAAGISIRDGRYANLFPERFHCTGVAVRGKASAGGRVMHARVLDYMRDINLQAGAAVIVFMPQGYNKWMTLSYAGFIGTVTAMNEHGLAVGEMGGRGLGDWDGMPMSLLLRDVMERAKTVGEAMKIIEETPRTCEYYYVLSDKNRNIVGLHCTADKVEVMRPGRQHPLLPTVPEDTVLISGPDRAQVLSRRLLRHYGKIDAATMIEIIKRPVAMSSNLHNAVFLPETLDMWVADAGRHTVACDEPYARCNLAQLIRFYEETTALGCCHETRLCLKREGEAPAEPRMTAKHRLSRSFALPINCPCDGFPTKPSPKGFQKTTPEVPR